MTTLVEGGPRSVSLEGTSLVSAFLFRDTPQFVWFSSFLHFVFFFDAPPLSTDFDSLHNVLLFFDGLHP